MIDIVVDEFSAGVFVGAIIMWLLMIFLISLYLSLDTLRR